ncbi:MAG: AAA family ATPase [Polyangiaceae bacterium]
MTHQLFQSLRLDGLLSFAPGSPAVELRPLNVLIGPNGSGKSNFIEAFELLSALPTSLQNHIRGGGTPEDWIWKGKPRCTKATVAVQIQRDGHPREEYQLALGLVGQRLDVDAESFQELVPAYGSELPFVYADIQGKVAKVATKFVGPDGPSSKYEPSVADRNFMRSDESVFTQRKETVSYPDLNDLATRFSAIYSFREWSFGKYGEQRAPQSTALPNDVLLPDGSNLALFLNDLEHVDYVARGRLDDYVKRFLPRFERLSTRVIGGTTQLYFHEAGCLAPIPAQRLSDGTLRFIAMLAALLAPKAAPIICLDEPELGLHPDAMTILAELLLETSTRTQLVVTTHSEALLSRLSDNSDSVLVCEHLGDTTVLERLDPEKLKFWLDRYSLGEIWRVGELGGNP